MIKDVILLAILVFIIGKAVLYIVKAKKSGVKCIGCPAAGNCSRNRNINKNCSCSEDNCCS